MEKGKCPESRIFSIVQLVKQSGRFSLSDALDKESGKSWKTRFFSFFFSFQLLKQWRRLLLNKVWDKERNSSKIVLYFSQLVSWFLKEISRWNSRRRGAERSDPRTCKEHEGRGIQVRGGGSWHAAALVMSWGTHRDHRHDCDNAASSTVSHIRSATSLRDISIVVAWH